MVTGAYRELEAEGLVESRVGRGTTVKPPVGEKEEGTPAGRPLVWKHLFSRQGAQVTSPLISDVHDTRGDRNEDGQYRDGAV